MISITDVRKSVADKSEGNSTFDGVKIPFLKEAHGKTRLQFLSELDIHENNIPPVTFYRYYKPATPIDKGNYKIYELAYEEGDTFEPSFVAQKKKDGKKITPSTFPMKGFAYVINLTALKAVQIFTEKGGDENTSAEELKKMITSKDFNRDPKEAQAAKFYVTQYQQILKNAKNNDVELPDYHGIFIYNFKVSITRAIADFIDTLESDGEEMENIRLAEWVFALSKEGQDLKTEYSFQIDYPADEIPDSLTEPTYRFLDENDELSDFKGLIDRKRYKTDDDELEEEVKVSTLAEEDEGGW